MQQSSIRFEIRKGIKGAHKHNAMIQAGYDTADRMANLLGHIPFADLFGQSFDELIPRILPHVDRVAGYGLISEPEEVTELLCSLSCHHGGESFVTLADRICDDDDAPFPSQARVAVGELWCCHGIRLPDISANYQNILDVRQSIREVMQHAGDLSYRAIWEVPLRKDMKTARIAIRRAADRHVIHLGLNNGLCCSTSQCVVGNSADLCYTYTGLCVTGSTNCSSHLAIAEGDADCGCC